MCPQVEHYIHQVHLRSISHFEVARWYVRDARNSRTRQCRRNDGNRCAGAFNTEQLQDAYVHQSVALMSVDLKVDSTQHSGAGHNGCHSQATDVEGCAVAMIARQNGTLWTEKHVTHSGISGKSTVDEGASRWQCMLSTYLCTYPQAA